MLSLKGVLWLDNVNKTAFTHWPLVRVCPEMPLAILVIHGEAKTRHMLSITNFSQRDGSDNGDACRHTGLCSSLYHSELNRWYTCRHLYKTNTVLTVELEIHTPTLVIITRMFSIENLKKNPWNTALVVILLPADYRVMPVHSMRWKGRMSRRQS